MTSCSQPLRPNPTQALVASAHWHVRRVARQLAPRLLHVFRIPAHENTLCPWLTSESAATNAEALEQWIIRAADGSLIDVDTDPTEQMLFVLAQRLQRLLQSIDEGQA